MDATTFLDMQNQAQAQIDELNSKIAFLTSKQNDLINVNNTAIGNVKIQCDQLLSDARIQASQIVADASAKALSITNDANQANADAAAYVASQKASIDAKIAEIKEQSDALSIKQAQLDKDSNDFKSAREGIIAELNAQADKAKSLVDDAIDAIKSIGN